MLLYSKQDKTKVFAEYLLETKASPSHHKIGFAIDNLYLEWDEVGSSVMHRFIRT